MYLNNRERTSLAPTCTYSHTHTHTHTRNIMCIHKFHSCFPINTLLCRSYICMYMYICVRTCIYAMRNISLWDSMELGPEDVFLLERCPHFEGCYVQALGPEDVSLLERCPHFRGCYMYVQASMELGPEDVSLLERCPHFEVCYVQALGPEDVSLLERCPHFGSQTYGFQRYPKPLSTKHYLL